MGYRDDFYTRDNIIGYTGDLHGPFTVYFADAGVLNPRTKEVNGRLQVLVSFGRITQEHPHEDNIGRGKVHECYSYSISNVQRPDGREHAQECVYGRSELKALGMKVKGKEDEHLSFHPSRNRFESVTAGNINLLAGAIRRFPDAKAKVNDE
jgi:hypothetical protein